MANEVASTPAGPLPAASPSASGARLVRFLKFGVVGGTGVIVNLALVTLLHGLWGASLLLVAPIAVEISTLSNYLLNRAWTWRDRDRSWWSLLSYHAVTLVGACIQLAVLFVGVELFHLHYIAASLLGVAVATAWNFLGSDRASFVEYTPERKARHLRVFLYGSSLSIHLFLASVLAHDWDTFVFQKTVENFLGQGVTPYATGIAKPDYVYFGTGLPLQPMWYAYPPLPLLLMSITYSPVVFGLTSSPWLGRLLIKLPFVAANLGLAFVAHRMVTTRGDADPETRRRRALKLEAFLLFNPLFVFVATIWGMFETLLLTFMVLSFLSMRNEKWATAGAFWGAATLVKIFPLYLVPVLGLHILRRGGWKASVRYFLAGGLVFGLVSLPFWATQPGGYIEQVFRMHANRPPARFTPISFLYEGLRNASRMWPGTLPDDPGLVEVCTTLSFSLTIAVLGLLALASLRHAATERALVLWSGLSLLGGLLVTKVVSEQYLLLPLGLLAIALWHPEPLPRMPDPAHLRKLLVHSTAWVCFAALLDNVHFLLFLPDDVAQRVLGRSLPETILALAHSLGLTAGELRAILLVTYSIGLFIPLWFGVRLVGPALLEGFRVFTQGAHQVVRRIAPAFNVSRIVLLAAILLLTTPAMAVGVMAPKRYAAPEEAGVVEGPLFLVHYRTDWFNPTNRYDVQAGPWASSDFTPTSGYYNTVAHKIAKDLEILRAGRMDGVVIQFDPAFEGQASAGRLVAGAFKIPFAIEIDLRHIAEPQGSVPITPASADAASELLNGPSFPPFWGPGYHMRLAPDAGYIVFLKGADLVVPSFTEDERRHIADILADRIGRRAARAMEENAGRPLWETSPKDLAELHAETGAALLWRDAYQRATEAWWSRAVQLDPAGTRLDLVLDAPVDLPLQGTDLARVVGTYDPIGAEPGPASPGLRFTAVNADPASPETYGAAWSDAVRSRPHGILVPWNHFDARLGIEPTVEHGSELLHLTERWAASFRNIGQTPTLPTPPWSPTVAPADVA